MLQNSSRADKLVVPLTLAGVVELFPLRQITFLPHAYVAALFPPPLQNCKNNPENKLFIVAFYEVIKLDSPP